MASPNPTPVVFVEKAFRGTMSKIPGELKYWIFVQCLQGDDVFGREKDIGRKNWECLLSWGKVKDASIGNTKELH